MVVINYSVQIPDQELSWSFVRSGGPGGQNVNKVASKAELRWALHKNTTLPEDVKLRLRQQQKRRITQNEEMILTSDRYRDQERNRQDCLNKLRHAVLDALHVPKKRKPTKPSRASNEARLRQKNQRSRTKNLRRKPTGE